MTIDRLAALEALLAAAETAHGAYEATVLNGVYDEEWPRWYASYAVDHGIASLVGRAVTVDELATFFATGWDDARRADQPPTDPWPRYTARRIAEQL